MNLTSLFGPNGTINYINTKIMPSEVDEESILYDHDDIEKYLNDTVMFVKKELNRLKQIKEQDDLKIKIAVDIDDTLLCTKELEEYY